MSAGGNLGLGARRNDLEALSIANQGQQIGNQAKEAADRLNLDYSSLNQKAAEASDRGSETAARIASERENAAALLALRAQEAQTSSLYHQGELGRQLAADAALQQFHQATAGTQAQRATDLAKHRATLEGLAADKLKQNQGRWEEDSNGNEFWVSGTGAPHAAKTFQPPDAKEPNVSVPINPEVPNGPRVTGKLSDPYIRQLLGTNAPGYVAPQGSTAPAAANPDSWWQKLMGAGNDGGSIPTDDPLLQYSQANNLIGNPAGGSAAVPNLNVPAPAAVDNSPYKVGARYGDLRYLGGDWQDENSWEPAVQATPAGDEP